MRANKRKLESGSHSTIGDKSVDFIEISLKLNNERSWRRQFYAAINGCQRALLRVERARARVFQVLWGLETLHGAGI
jgi:hypothetical protein